MQTTKRKDLAKLSSVCKPVAGSPCVLGSPSHSDAFALFLACHVRFVTCVSECSPWCGKSDDFCGFSLIFAEPGLEKEVGKSKKILFVFDLRFGAA